MSEPERRRAEKIGLPGSTREVLPIPRLDGGSVGGGRPGPMHARAFALYKDYKRAFCAGEVE